jgi:outer membrane cobalamin receptor
MFVTAAALVLASLSPVGAEMPSATSVVVSASDGAAVAGATVTFVAPDGRVVRIRTDGEGRASVPFRAVTLQIRIAGCPPETAVPSAHVRIVLPCAVPAIAIVRVATGSPETLHLLPFAASVLDEREIANAPASTGDALLGMLPGFDRDRSNSAFTNYGQLRVSFDGAGSDRGLVLADGVPAQDGFGGQIDWAEYPAADIIRAELLRGPGSALYGAGGVGGVLSLDTLAPTNSSVPALGEIAIGGGTHGFERLSIGGTAPLSQALTISMFASFYGLRYYDLPPDYSSPIDNAAQAEQSMAAVRVQYAASATSTIAYEYRAAWDDQAEGRPNYDFARRLLQNDLHYVWRGERSYVEIIPYVRNVFITNRADQYPTAPGVLRYTQYVPSAEDGAALHWNVDAGASALNIVADARFVHGQSEQYGPTGAFQNLGSGLQRLGGLGAQETLSGARWQIVAGARIDVESFLDGALVATTGGGYATFAPPARTSRAISPRAALRYDLSKHLAFRIADGGGLRLPYLNELVRSYRIAAVTYQANPNLIPERSSSLSAGLDWLNGTQHASLDLFRTFVGDAIMFRTITPTEQMYENVNRTQTDGVTLTYSEAITPGARVTLSSTEQYARVVSGDPAILGKRLQYVPESDERLAFDGTIGAVGVGVTVSYLGQTFADDLNTEPLGSAVVVGVHAAFPLTNGEQLVLDAQNLTGARYLSSIDRYGQPMVVSLTVRAVLDSSR